MFTKRQNQVGRELQKELSDVFQRLGGSILPGVLITVTVVRISPDLTVARVYLSLFPASNKEELIKKVDAQKSIIRNELGKKIKNQFRRVPELAFFVDDSAEYAENINSLLG